MKSFEQFLSENYEDYKRKSSDGKKKMTTAQKSAAKKHAANAGRPYPNFVDNMAAMKEDKSHENPEGGLSAAGRAHHNAKDGGNLKAGVKTKGGNMSASDMRRKGSWAARFYGRKGELPPLKKPNGEPTRFALTAKAWGEPVPKTAGAARAIAAKGRRLLDKYQAKKDD
jgi:hypothetical protein